MRANLSALCRHLFTQHTHSWEDLMHSIREGSPGTWNNTTQGTSTNSNLQIISFSATDLLCKKESMHTHSDSRKRKSLSLLVCWKVLEGLSPLLLCHVKLSQGVEAPELKNTSSPHICTSKATKLGSGCSNYRLSNDLLQILKKSNPIFDTLCGYCYCCC